MSTAIERQRRSGGRVSASTVHHIISMGSADVIYQDTAPQRSGDWFGKGVAPTQSLVNDLPRSSLGVISTERALQWWSQKTVNPPIPVIGLLSIRLDISLNIIRGCQLPKSGLRLGYPLFWSSDIRLFALYVVTNLRTVVHCSRSEGMQTMHQETRNGLLIDFDPSKSAEN